LSVALSVMSGFEKDLRGRLLAFTPQVTIERSDGGVWNPGELEKKIAAMPEVVASGAVRHVAGDGGVEHGLGCAGPGVGRNSRGVQPHDNAVLKELKDTLENGTLADLETTHPVTDRRPRGQAGRPTARRDFVGSRWRSIWG